MSETSGSEITEEKISRRTFLKRAAQAGVALAAGSLLKPQHTQAASHQEKLRKVEGATEELKPGKKAPETWGGAGKFDVAAVYVDDPEFSGQAVILLQHDKRVAMTLLDGRKKDGTIVKGMNTVEGFEVYSRRDKLHISLGGGSGGAFLRYDPEGKTLDFVLNGFLIYDTEGERLDLRSQVRVDPDKSRILYGYDPSYLQYYMRAGTRGIEGSGTRSLMVAHASLRDIPKIPRIDQQVESLTDFWIPLLPTVAISKDGNSLYVVQPKDITNPGELTAFAWNARGHDMRAETDVTIKRDSDPSGEHTYPVPKKLEINFKDKTRTIVANIAPTDKFGFPVEFPNPITGDKVKAKISLPILRAAIGDRPFWLMTQTAANGMPQ